jgi:hypothetical protein
MDRFPLLIVQLPERGRGRKRASESMAWESVVRVGVYISSWKVSFWTEIIAFFFKILMKEAN